MKAKREHRVALSARALEVLQEARALHNGDLVFPSRKTGRALGSSTFWELLRALGIPGTVHGFRAAFSSWAAENGVERGVREACLAHVVKGVEGAYQRSDLHEQRRAVMGAWADYVTQGVRR